MQQEETLNFFKGHVDAWQKKAEDAVYSVINDRHRAVHEVMKCYPTGSVLLDVGCGTGQLAIEASRQGWDAFGLDFAQEMIDKARENNAADGTRARFVCASVFDFDFTAHKFDVISAQGFVEYISRDQLDEFLSLAAGALTPGGAVAIGSRNRLFNILSFNEYSEMERDLGSIEMLIEEAIALEGAGSQQEAIERISKLEGEYRQPERHPKTGIGVATRYQYSPRELVEILARNGLKATGIYPVHYHAMPVSVLSDAALFDIQRQTAEYLSRHMISNPVFVPRSSSYVMMAIRR